LSGRSPPGDQYENESLPLLRVPEWTADIEEAQAALEQLCEGARTLVFFGTGGSSLGGQAVAQLGGWFIPGVEKGDQKKRPRTRFYDNLDPLTLERVLAGLDLATTRFVVISKSGGTLETVAQALAAMKAVSDAGLGDRMPELFLGVTGAGSPGNDNNLRALFSSHCMPMLEHHAGLGGRFSVLSNVGMLPALARGLDTAAFRSGARQVVQALLAANDPEGFAPAVGAATTIGLARDRNIRSVIMMPYSDRLGRFADWFVQLWAESLGKGGAGTTPLAALGPVDQHSQLQLFLDGPRDHLVTVIRQDASGTGPLLDAELATSAGVQMIAGRTVGDLVNAQQQAIPQALIEAGRPVRTIDIESLDESVLGGLMMHFMLETILAAHLLGVDPYDQPAVEAGKVLTRRYLET
jgi:glucose-6-phosphate isomerase